MLIFFSSVLLGSDRDHPGHSCKHMRDLDSSKQNGEYWIDPGNTGNPIKVYCDMTTKGGMFRKVSQQDIG